MHGYYNYLLENCPRLRIEVRPTALLQPLDSAAAAGRGRATRCTPRRASSLLTT